jgi:hypothetical protein
MEAVLFPSSNGLIEFDLLLGFHLGAIATGAPARLRPSAVHRGPVACETLRDAPGWAFWLHELELLVQRKADFIV